MGFEISSLFQLWSIGRCLVYLWLIFCLATWRIVFPSMYMDLKMTSCWYTAQKESELKRCQPTVASALNRGYIHLGVTFHNELWKAKQSRCCKWGWWHQCWERGAELKKIQGLEVKFSLFWVTPASFVCMRSLSPLQ